MNIEELNRGTSYLLKNAGALGRIANMFTQDAQSRIDSPFKATGASMIPIPLVDQMVSRRATMGGTEEDIQNNLKQQQDQLRQRSMGENAMHGAKQIAKPMGLLGALTGGVYGGLLGATDAQAQGHQVLPRMIGGGLLGAGIGGLGAAAGGALAGAGNSVVNKLIQENTSKDSQSRARGMLAKHPYATSIPLFGNVIGGALA